jgi:hypothetical protein
LATISMTACASISRAPLSPVRFLCRICNRRIHHRPKMPPGSSS